MACFSPLRAWRTDDGEILFRAEAGGSAGLRRGRPTSPHQELQLPCGQCTGCRLERSREWALRCVHEASCHEANSFVSLTYDDKHLSSISLVYEDFQLFLKRLRKSRECFDVVRWKWVPGKVRYFAAGEYGEEGLRPHFHAILFGVGFPDRVFLKSTPSGSDLYRSPELEGLWKYGFSSIGDVTFESAAYVARYVVKKVTGSGAEDHYWHADPRTGELVQVEPEFAHMSRRPGIGETWIRKWYRDVYPRDRVIHRGIEHPVPRYYDRMAEKYFPEMLYDLDASRQARNERFAADNSESRLRVRAEVARARLRFKRRGKIK